MFNIETYRCYYIVIETTDMDAFERNRSKIKLFLLIGQLLLAHYVLSLMRLADVTAFGFNWFYAVLTMAQKGAQNMKPKYQSSSLKQTAGKKVERTKGVVCRIFC